MKLEHKLFLLLAGLVIGAAALVNFQNYRQATRDIDHDLRVGQQDKMNALVRVSQDALISGNDLALVDYSRIVKPLNEYAVWASVVRENGEVVAHTDPSEIGKTVAIPPAQDPAKLLFVAAVSSGGHTVGWVLMAADQGKLAHAAATEFKTAKRHAQQAFAWAAIAAIPFTFLLAYLAMLPLRRVLNTAQALSKAGDGENAGGSRDELGDLASQVNKMAERLYGATGSGHEDSLKLAHDLKSPLAAIQSYLYLIEETPDSKDDVRKNIEAVRSSAQRLSQMVTDILEKEKVLDGRSDSTLAVLSVEASLRKVYDMHKAGADQKGVYLMEPGVPYGMPGVLANEEHLDRVMDNLVSNGIKYTPKDGSVWCEVEVKGGEVWVMVNDTGLGMEPEEIPTLFKRFERGRSTEVQQRPGAGLGLYIAKELVEVMGGRIWAASRGKGQGTTVIFTLKAVFDEVTA